MGRTEKPPERLQASRGHRHWAKEIGRNQTLFGVNGEVRSKNNLTQPALLEMSGNAGGLNGSTQHHESVDPPILPLKNRSVWLTRRKPGQGNIPADLT